MFLEAVYAAEPNPPTWDTNKVKVFTPGQSNAQSVLDAVHKTQGGKSPGNNGQFSSGRYALLFEPGTHNVNVDVGFYVTVHGLGKAPTDTTLAKLITQNGSYDPHNGALCNFWRSAENVHVPGSVTWAVSQASPIRRLVIDGNLQLHQDGAYSSGGYMSDCTVKGKVSSGSQQQFFYRNNNWGSYSDGNWNMVFVGTQNAPKSHCGRNGGHPFTTIDSTPIIVEKPYIVKNGSGYSLMSPRVETNKVGPTPNYDNADEIAFDKVYVANENDSAATINAKLDEGLHLVLQPGNYKLSDTIKVTKANTIVLGMGLATLISSNGQPCIEVSNVDGVKVSGILFQAGAQDTESLLKWGSGGFEGSASNPGAMHDVFARVGGPDRNQVTAKTMIQVNSGNVIVDDTWLWRADHDVNGSVKNSKNPSKTGLQVNGNNVVGYALMSEHHLGNLLEWNGENGKTYFYQSELPYDVDSSYADKGFAGYVVGDKVQNHEAWGVAVYTFFRDHNVMVNSGIKAPAASGVKFHNSVSVFLTGNGGERHVINNSGSESAKGHNVNYVCEYVSGQEFTKATIKRRNLNLLNMSFLH